MLLEVTFLHSLLQALAPQIQHIDWSLLMPAPHFKGNKRKRKQEHLKHHKKMHKQLTLHMRQMQNIQHAIKVEQEKRKYMPVAMGGVASVKPGQDMNRDILSKAGAAKQKFQERVHRATKPKDLATQQRINALRYNNHASRVRAQQRAADVFGAEL